MPECDLYCPSEVSCGVSVLPGAPGEANEGTEPPVAGGETEQPPRQVDSGETAAGDRTAEE